MSVNFDIQSKTFNISGHGIADVGYPRPAYIDSNGAPQIAQANNIQQEAFGLITVIDANTLEYSSEDTLIKAIGHGFTPGDIIYLQDDGTLANTPGTFIQKIFEVIDSDCLNYLNQPMFSTFDSLNGIARIPLNVQTVNNVGAVWNKITFNTPTFDNIGLTIAGNVITFPDTGIIEAMLVINFFDNNSARVAHRVRLNVAGGIYSVIEGENYMRDATFHDNSSIKFPDAFSINANESINYEIQSHSSLANTSNITGGWLILKRL